jgi:hypothetical protein
LLFVVLIHLPKNNQIHPFHRSALVESNDVFFSETLPLTCVETSPETLKSATITDDSTCPLGCILPSVHDGVTLTIILLLFFLEFWPKPGPGGFFGVVKHMRWVRVAFDKFEIFDLVGKIFLFCRFPKLLTTICQAGFYFSAKPIEALKM